MSTVETKWDDGFLNTLTAAVDNALKLTATAAAEMAGASMTAAGKAAGNTSSKVRTRNFRASAPGGPPGVRSARLKNSLTFARVREGTYAFGTNVKYARVHELGGSVPGNRPYFVSRLFRQAVFIKEETAARMQARGFHVGRTRPMHVMPARPFLRPVVTQRKQQLGTVFNSSLAKSLASKAIQGAIA